MWYLRELFLWLTPSARIETPRGCAARDKELVRRIVASRAEGNINLSLGRYRTEKDVEREFRAVSEATF